jgi:UDP-N-acetylmuramate--alanine ligase
VVGHDFAGRRVHLIGIGGCGMRGAARVLLRRGAIVTGSDAAASDAIGDLLTAGARVTIGQTAPSVPRNAHLVVYSSAIKPDNPELVAARRLGIETIKYAELLGRLMVGRDGVAIAGTHGKSTTTALTAFLLHRAALDPSYVIGAMVEQLGGGSGSGDGSHFVVEACEYDRSFLRLAPRIAAILNVEEDHLDCYANLDEIIDAFGWFAELPPAEGLLVVNGECEAALKAAHRARAAIETFGFGPGVTWQAVNVRPDAGCFRFEIARHGTPVTETSTCIPGRHNVANALAATAIAERCGVPLDVIGRLIPEFRGAQRRLTLRGRVEGVTVVDDYAHHPTEIRATLQAARDYFNPRRLWVVFQPHQHSRTRFLLADFARSFAAADVVVVPDIYFVRDSQAERERVTARDLVDRIREHGADAAYVPSFERIVGMLTEAVAPGDVVLTMGAGNVWKVADTLVAELMGTTPMGEFVTYAATHASPVVREGHGVG